MNIQNIPGELRQYRQFVVWRLEERKGKKTKVPYNPRTGALASSTDPDTWSDLDDALAAMAEGKYAGIGFVFHKASGITGIDLDDVLKGGKLSWFAEDIVNRFGSYAEISPSGTGLHILVRGQISGKGINRAEIEIYDQGRFFTLTGDVFRNLGTIRDGGQELQLLYAKLNKRRAPVVPLRIPVDSQRVYQPPEPVILEGLFKQLIASSPKLLCKFLQRRNNPSDCDFSFACELVRQYNFRPSNQQHIEIMQALIFLYRHHHDGNCSLREAKAFRTDYLCRTISAAFGQFHIKAGGRA